eukprot:scaffold9426_cov90-Isochrysis_galbana.AAC.5
MGLGSNWACLLAVGLPALGAVGGASGVLRFDFGAHGRSCILFYGAFRAGVMHGSARCGERGKTTHEKRVLEAQEVHRILTSASAQNTQALHGSGALATATSASRAC